jgi:hypothetical protein
MSNYTYLFCYNARVQLNEIRMLVEMTKLISNVRVRIDFLESVIGLQIKEFAQLV